MRLLWLRSPTPSLALQAYIRPDVGWRKSRAGVWRCSGFWTDGAGGEKINDREGESSGSLCIVACGLAFAALCFASEARAGSVSAGMRVNVQLIDAESGNHLWAERFDKPLADLFDMQDEIVARLANALNAQLAAAEARRAESAPNPELDGPLFSGYGLVI